MSDPFNESHLAAVLNDHIFKGPGFDLLEILINSHNLHSTLLRVSSCESIRFSLDPTSVRSVHPPEFHRLVLVRPESFEVNWMLSVSGYYMVKYPSVDRIIPHRVDAVKICYSGIAITAQNSFIFKNEHVKLA